MTPTRGPLALILGLALAACATTSEPTPGSTTAPSDATTVPRVTTTPAPSTSAAPTSTTGPTTTNPATTTMAGTTVPGERVDFGPRSGDQLMVIGVSYDDFLNLRELPGTSFNVIGEIPADFRELKALGDTRDIGRSFWTRVDYAGTVGWVHMGFVGFEGATDDLTALVVDRLGGRPRAETMSDLGLTVAEIFVSEEPESDVVKVVDETLGDLGEVTYDVIGLGDDSVRGLRVHVFGEPSNTGFTLRTVEVTNICGRGVAGDGLCP